MIRVLESNNVKKFTIKSISDEGVYYLVNGWNKYRAFWKTEDELKPEMLFQSASDAKRSLTKLLKVMPEYATDKFEIVQIDIE